MNRRSSMREDAFAMRAAEVMKAEAIAMLNTAAAVYRQSGCTDSAAAIEHMAVHLAEQLRSIDMVRR